METRRARMRDIFFVATGATPKSTEPTYWNGDIPWVTPDDLSHCDGATTSGGARFLTEDGYASCGTTLVPQGAIVISTRAPIGYVAVADNSLCFNQGCKALIPRSNEDSRYWRYVITAERAGLNSFGRGSTYAELSTQALKDFPVEWPAVDAQRQVAAFLDAEMARVDELLAEKERFIELLAEKRAAIITHAVTKGLDRDADMKDSGVEWLGEVPAGWGVGRLSDLAREPIVYGIVLPGPHVEDGVPVLRGCDLKAGHLDLDTLARTTPDIAAGFTRSQLHPGELVYSIRASWGDCVVVPDYLDGANITQDSVRIAPLQGVDVRWLKYLLLSDAVAGFVRSQLRGATIKGINVFDLRRCRVPAIGTCQQRAIADYLDCETALIDELVDATRESITLLKEYRSALITAAVTGKIDVSAYAATEGDSQ